MASPISDEAFAVFLFVLVFGAILQKYDAPIQSFFHGLLIVAIFFAIVVFLIIGVYRITRKR